MALDAIIHRQHPNIFQNFFSSPTLTIAKAMYAQRTRIELSIRPTNPQLSIVCVSDTHNGQPPLPSGDILIHAGDLTLNGTAEELQAQLDWLNNQLHRFKIVIAGNHDLLLDPVKAAELSPSRRTAREELRWGSLIYLQDSSTQIMPLIGERMIIYGCPWTRKYGNWAFQFQRGTDAFGGRIDEETHIVVTHSPPKNHLDLDGWGDESLLRELWRVMPMLLVCGHIHAGYGRDVLVYDRFEEVYERLCGGTGGILGLLSMVWLLFMVTVFGPDPNARKTILINAAIGRRMLGKSVQVVEF